MRSRYILLRIGALALLFALAGSLVSAQLPDRGADAGGEAAQSAEGVTPLALVDDQPYQYMVKFMCGDTLFDQPSPLIMGNYFTAINVANYTDHNVKIYFRPLPHYASYWGTSVPAVIPLKGFSIRPRRDLEIDCADVWNMFGNDYFSFAKGVMHIGTPERLPVIAVYTVGLGKDPATEAWDYKPQSIDVEYVDPFIAP